jgi:hypothetical protein
MKMMLKNLKRPAYRGAQIKLHPHLKVGDVAHDENVTILETLLKVEEKEIK